jgi:hypothetical protein
MLFTKPKMLLFAATMVAENSVTELQKTGDFSKIPHLSRKMSNEEAFSPF